MISHAKISRHHRMFKTLTGLSATCEGKKHDKNSLTSRLCASPKAQSSGRIPAFRAMNPQGSRPCKQRRNPRGANSAPKRRRPIGVSPRYGCASSTVSPESRSSVASVTFIAASKPALRTPSSKPPADCTISGATSPSRQGSRRHEPRNRNGKTPRRLTRLFAIRSNEVS